ncbi:MAG: hypothetical protein MJZ14_06145 [Paludibacteraceae bacterium]|nr:hypothetical protein [Paludibacteraceae bacterium]
MGKQKKRKRNFRQETTSKSTGKGKKARTEQKESWLSELFDKIKLPDCSGLILLLFYFPALLLIPIVIIILIILIC